MLEIIKFIKQNKDWHTLLQDKPYSLIIKEKENLFLFKYHQIYSDMYEKICQECRGLILEKDTWKVVRCAFFKFFNYGEPQAAKIDLNNFRVVEKIDGSLISLYYYNNQWNIATNGVIDAKDAGLQFETIDFKNYYDLFTRVSLDYDKLNPKNTYTFELVSPYNRVVIPYPEIKIYHIGTRNNETLKELNEDIGIEKPKEYSFKSFEDIIENSKKLSYDQEGYIALDNNWNRVKIKSPAYVSIHYLKNRGTTYKKILTLVRQGEREEFLNYFPEYQKDFEYVEKKYYAYIEDLGKDLKEAENLKFENRKEFALWAKNKTNPWMLFMWLDKRIKTVKEFLDLLDENKFDKTLFN